MIVSDDLNNPFSKLILSATLSATLSAILSAILSDSVIQIRQNDRKLRPVWTEIWILLFLVVGLELVGTDDFAESTFLEKHFFSENWLEMERNSIIINKNNSSMQHLMIVIKWEAHEKVALG